MNVSARNVDQNQAHPRKRRLKKKHRRLALRLAYDGAGFSGFQQQPGRRTVEGELRRVLGEVGLPPSLSHAGRTDAGVHALGQVVLLRFPEDRDLPDVINALRQHLPEDIQIKNHGLASERFHPRWSAKERHYTYWLCLKKVTAGKAPWPSVGQLRSEPVSNADLRSGSALECKSELSSKSEMTSESELEPKSELESESEMESEAELESEGELESESEVGSESDLRSESAQKASETRWRPVLNSDSELKGRPGASLSIGLESNPVLELSPEAVPRFEVVTSSDTTSRIDHASSSDTPPRLPPVLIPHLESEEGELPPKPVNALELEPGMQLESLEKALSALRQAQDLGGFVAHHKDHRSMPALRELRCEFRRPLLILHFRGPGFGRYAIRNMVGCALAEARGELPEGRCADIARSGKSYRGPRAPAGALLLENVVYPMELDPFSAGSVPTENGSR